MPEPRVFSRNSVAMFVFRFYYIFHLISSIVALTSNSSKALRFICRFQLNLIELRASASGAKEPRNSIVAQESPPTRNLTLHFTFSHIQLRLNNVGYKLTVRGWRLNRNFVCHFCHSGWCNLQLFRRGSLLGKSAMIAKRPRKKIPLQEKTIVRGKKARTSGFCSVLGAVTMSHAPATMHQYPFFSSIN